MASTLLDNLIAYWPLGEASGQRNDVHRTNHLTDNNTVGQTTGVIGPCASFVAANSEYLSIADNADLSTGDIDFAFSMWVKLANKSTNRGILSKYLSTVNGEFELYYSATQDRFVWVVVNGTLTSLLANALGSPSTGVWYHIIAWHDSVNNQIGIRINDQYQNTASHSVGAGDSTAEFHVGEMTFSYFDGDIDEVGFWKRLLTTAEKTRLYNSGRGLKYPFYVERAALSGLGRGIVRGL